MRKIIALVVAIALAVAGYQVYGDENKKAMLKEKVNEVIYDAENSLYYIIPKNKKRFTTRSRTTC
ncbi:hypothetical protein O163_04945 [Caldanaerobacter subterraneus subsp. yonseiensis KB-1]|uniref:Uncharacterized protein n=1 Tax=Caldanaerobacter subterraneus subsp. yonseiensis KB-1 TaxID=1388761 RepID=U5CRC1_CALSX|nr:hypothetical protein [Caldanaerobacter subterraneus]ERM92513.1 hypothetical protein O163_04945 [Caldanaerobacter subterraneus subsp. yonseiensis KB-1]